MCYKHRAVEDSYKLGLEPVVLLGAATIARREEVPPAGGSATATQISGVVVNAVDVSRYCPVCSQRLESRRCKLICRVCGYYMSCADYY